MFKEILESQWYEIKGFLKDKFPALTDDDFKIINGRYDELISRLEMKYGLTKEQAEEKIHTLLVNRFPAYFKDEKVTIKPLEVEETSSSVPRMLALVGIPLLFLLGFLAYENTKIADQPAIAKPVDMSKDVMVRSVDPADRVLLTGIQNAFSQDKLVAPDLGKIQIVSHGGVITLSGTVPTAQERDEIVQVVQQSSGVKQINNLIEVGSS